MRQCRANGHRSIDQDGVAPLGPVCTLRMNFVKGKVKGAVKKEAMSMARDSLGKGKTSAAGGSGGGGGGGGAAGGLVDAEKAKVRTAVRTEVKDQVLVAVGVKQKTPAAAPGAAAPGAAQGGAAGTPGLADRARQGVARQIVNQAKKNMLK